MKEEISGLRFDAGDTAKNIAKRSKSSSYRIGVQTRNNGFKLLINHGTSLFATYSCLKNFFTI